MDAAPRPLWRRCAGANAPIPRLLPRSDWHECCCIRLVYNWFHGLNGRTAMTLPFARD